jgi:hypothetical protein
VSNEVENFGYFEDREHQDAFAAESTALYGSPLDFLKADMDRPAFPYRAAALALKGTKYSKQRDGHLVLEGLSQGKVGACVGWGEARKIFLTLAAGVYMRGEDIATILDENGSPVSVSPQWCYAASRQAVNKLGRGDGSNGSWAARATAELGFVFEKKYENGFDASRYSAADCRNWARVGVPSASLQVSKEQRFRGRARVETFEDAVALIQAGYCFNLCNSQRPNNVRDERGFCKWTGKWAHSETGGLCYVVYKISPTKTIRGIGILNSHGSNRYDGGRGDLTPDLPDGAYMYDERDFMACLNRKDTWVSFDLEGLKPAAKQWEERVPNVA